MDGHTLKMKPIMLPYTQLADSYDSIKLLYREQISSYEIGRNGRTTQLLIGKMGYLPQHLYLVSDREIKTGDRYIDPKAVNIQVWRLYPEGIDISISEMGRVEATTDPSLGLPLIPLSFVEEWVDKQGKIESVYLKQNEDESLSIPYDLDNKTKVIILPVKESWNREELKEVYKRYIIYDSNFDNPNISFEDWFDKNY